MISNPEVADTFRKRAKVTLPAVVSILSSKLLIIIINSRKFVKTLSC